MKRLLSEMQFLPALYIHVPFCRSKCGYCDFYSLAGQPPEVQRRILQRTFEQIDFFLQQISPGTIGTVYIGGGTPNSLEPETFSDILERAAALCVETSVTEWTVELNPECITSAQLSELREAGVSRISVGAQSFSEPILRFLSRNTTADETRGALELVSDTWEGSWNIDLITAVPGQTEEAALDDLGKAVGFGPDHISFYSLTVEAGTPLADREAAGGFIRKSDEEAAAALRRGWDMLRAAGYSHYEVSNFARPGRSSRHNLYYWRMHPYLGAGPGAVSTLPAAHGNLPLRLSVSRNFEEFLDGSFFPETGPGTLNRVAGTTRKALDAEMLREGEFLLEYLMMGLRTVPGIELNEFRRIFGTDIRNVIPGTIERALRDELLTLDPSERRENCDYLSPTETGMLLLDAVLLQAAVEAEKRSVELNWPPRETPLK
jgi:oxygen-independent coproporphyrinogen-3 oxidase